MQLVGYSNTAQKTLESNAILWWRKYLRENIGQERCTKKGIYGCLVGTADSRVQRSDVVEPHLPILPIHKQNNKAQINNQKTCGNAQPEMLCHVNATKQIIK